MKTLIFYLAVGMLCLTGKLYSQKTIITDDTGYTTGESSAVLELKSNTTGFLLPRLTSSEIQEIDSPAEGLMVYNLTLSIPVYFDGDNWCYLNGLVLGSEFPAGAVFVSPFGTDDPANGSQDFPLKTISYALSQAGSTDSDYVIVANGVYNEMVELVDGINLLGGYDPSTWKRNLSSTQTIISSGGTMDGHTITVKAANISSPTIFEGFKIYGANNDEPNHNSYGVYIISPGSLFQIRNNFIHAGNAASGQNAWDGSSGLPGSNGLGRDTDPDVFDENYDAFVTAGSPCSSSYDRQHNNGAIGFIGSDDVSGGHGGGNQCPPDYNVISSAIAGFAGQAGSGMNGGAGGVGGGAGYDSKMQSGTCYLPDTGNPHGLDGGNGGNGANGMGGDAGSNIGGFVVAGHWLAASGSDGQSGGNGGGGGGGGAGGGAECVGCSQDRIGAHGGGGGSGGGGGTAGTGGSGGGGSFGIFILNGTAPVLEGNTIYLGNGGNGGNGGNAGTGASGGTGGLGGLCPDNYCYCYNVAGAGGSGGNGGHGGGGGGGCGGNAFGIYTKDLSGTPNYTASNFFSGGQGGNGGNGGSSPGSSGISGINGAVVNCSYN